MSTPSTVDRAFRTALYDTTDAALDTAASLLAADPAADAEVARRGEEFLAAAWRRHWQPADVVRVVRRELDDVHVRLAAELIRAQAAHDRPRGPRWTAQVDALPAPGPAARPDRFAHATAVLELYRLLLRLPDLEPLDAPGGPRSRPQAGPGAGAESRSLARIRALLAKAEATGYPEEAEALSAKAQELMARYSVDEALLAARAPAPDAPGACRIGVEPPTSRPRRRCRTRPPSPTTAVAVRNEPLAAVTAVAVTHVDHQLQAVAGVQVAPMTAGTATRTPCAPPGRCPACARSRRPTRDSPKVR
ncbi:hypothetical protein SFUMM280S_02998 [Streptomyces fumanus]